MGLVTWALTGLPPNDLATACDESVTVSCAWTEVVQELHMVLIHAFCDYLGDPGDQRRLGVGAASLLRTPA